MLCCTLAKLSALGQGKEFMQLEYRNKENFKERNNFLKDTIWRFNQIVEFDIPNVIDEESWTRLTIEIKDTSSFFATKLLILPRDSATASHQFAFWNVWFAKIPQDSTSLSGEIRLLKTTKDEITLKLNLIVRNIVTRDRYIYSGEGTFRRTNSIYDFYQK